jgi:thioredoxin reductase (NADPH)
MGRTFRVIRSFRSLLRGRARRPVIFVVDDDPPSRETIINDLRRRFGNDYRIVSAGSPQEGIGLLKQLAAERAEVALIAADLQMAEIDGVEFLEQGRALHRDAKRALLVTMNRRGTVAIVESLEPLQHALALGRIDISIPKGWVSPEEWLYPQVQQALSDWANANRPHKEVVRIVGEQWDPASHRMRDLLNRNVVRFGFYDADSAEGRELLRSVGAAGEPLPVVIYQDGFYLSRPNRREVAEALGVQTNPASEIYDLVIIGAGPAGLSSAVFATSEGLSTLVIEAQALGGQAGTSAKIRNYLGFPQGLSGRQLTSRAFEQAMVFGTQFLFMQEAIGIDVVDGCFLISLSDCEPARARAVIVAIGMQYRRLAIPGLDRLVGAGVYYGSAGVEAPAMAGQQVFVVGGANSAGQAAVHLARYAAQVLVAVRGESLEATMSRYLIDELEATPNIEVLLRTRVVGAGGTHRLETLTLENARSGLRQEVEAAALFVLIGAESCANWLTGELETDDRGYLMTGRDLSLNTWQLSRPPLPFETSLPGIFAVGDVRHGSVKRVAGAVGEGSVAVGSVHQYLEDLAEA